MLKRTLFATASLLFYVVVQAQQQENTVIVSPQGTRSEQQTQKTSWAQKQIGDSSQVLVSSSHPIFLHGQRLDPTDDIHTMTISKQQGIHVDGALYIPMIVPVIDEPARIEDGFFHYVVDQSVRIRLEAYDQGARQEEVAERLKGFYAQYSDSLTVVERPKGFRLTFQGRSLYVSSTKPSPIKSPEEQVDDYYTNALVPSFKTLLMYVEAGNLVICGNGYMNAIHPNDVEEAMTVLGELPKRAHVATRVGAEVVYQPIELVGGKYVLTTTAISDLLGFPVGVK